MASPIAGTLGGYAVIALALASLAALLMLRERRRLPSQLPERCHPAVVVSQFLRGDEPLPRREAIRLLDSVRAHGLIGEGRYAVSRAAMRFLARGPLSDRMGRWVVRWALRTG
ncbi:MAG: hypothetical protein QW410_03490 [Nitrososphaerota archaeon]|nr:hypothetical protein [Candidatus Calditenuis fumarioli]